MNTFFSSLLQPQTDEKAKDSRVFPGGGKKAKWGPILSRIERKALGCVLLSYALLR
jgi:hypothetical protein